MIIEITIKFFYIILFFIWFVRQVRSFLFWIYLWQLKDYHLGRFIDHFRTEKGKRLLFNPLLVFKIILLIYVCFLTYSLNILSVWAYCFWIFILIFLYVIEFVKFLKEIFFLDFKKPVLTQKTISLILIIFIFALFYLYILFQKFNFYIYWPSFYLLLFDILTPFIVSIFVFLIHLFTVLFFRNKIIKKATLKREKFPNLLVVGITGSYGKTSTKEFLATILSEKFNVLKTKEHQNSEVGISQCILNDLSSEHEIFVVEMGAYNKGGIKILSNIVKPKIGIVTGVNEQHLAIFGNMKNLLSAEGGKELVEELSENGVIFLNEKNKYCQEFYEKIKIKKYFYGKDAEFFGEENILGAIAVAKELGMTEKEIDLACQKIENKFPGIQIKKGINNVTVVDATYSSNPNSVVAHLDYLKTLRQDQGKIIIIMPCLIELGKASKRIHKEIGEKVAEVCDLVIITTKERFKELKEGAISNNKIKEENVLFIENAKEISEKLKDYLKSENIILLEGRLSKKIIL